MVSRAFSAVVRNTMTNGFATRAFRCHDISLVTGRSGNYPCVHLQIQRNLHEIHPVTQHGKQACLGISTARREGEEGGGRHFRHRTIATIRTIGSIYPRKKGFPCIFFYSNITCVFIWSRMVGAMGITGRFSLQHLTMAFYRTRF
jgi:hypothetical protein